jgi:hypothetical protein
MLKNSSISAALKNDSVPQCSWITTLWNSKAHGWNPHSTTTLTTTPQQQTKEALAQERWPRSLAIHFTMDNYNVQGIEERKQFQFCSVFHSIASNGIFLKQEQMSLKTLNFPIQSRCTCHPW